MKDINYAVLVYQAGIANVFAVDCLNMSDYGRNARRLIQSDFEGCENFARGLAAAGVKVCSVACNMPGDISKFKWTQDLESAPFSKEFNPVFNGVAEYSPFSS